MKQMPPKTQQTSRSRSTQFSLPQTASTSTRTHNFWANSCANSQNLNLFINNSFQKPTSSSLFLTSKANLLTPQKQYSDPLIRKFSEPLLSERSFKNISNTDNFQEILSKENPLSIRANNSKFYQKLKKGEENEKILSKRLILDSYGLLQNPQTSVNFNTSMHSFRITSKNKTSSEHIKHQSYETYGLRPQTQKLFLKETFKEEKRFKDISKEDIMRKRMHKVTENQHLDLLEPKTEVLNIKPNEFQSITEFSDDIFERNSKLRKKFKIQTFLSQKDEMKMKEKTNVEREINKKLVTPKLLEKIQKNIKKRVILVIENLYLSECKTKNNLKFCYLELPYIEEMTVLPSSTIDFEFQEVIRVLKEKFNLNSKELYIFLKNGTELKSHYEIPKQERMIIISGNRQFQGINRIVQGNKVKGFLLLKTLKTLEKPLLNNPEPSNLPISIEQHIKNNYRDVVEDVINVLGEEGDNDACELEKFNKRLKKKNIVKEDMEDFEKNARKDIERLVFKEKDEYMDSKNNGGPLIFSRKYDDICKICDLYEKHNEDIHFDQIELDDEDKDETGLLKELGVSNLSSKDMKKMANYLDYLLERWRNPKNKKNIKLNEEDSESKKEETIMIDLGGSNKEEENTKKDFLVENIKKHVTKKGYIQKLNKKNKEIFLQNIPKLLKRTNFTRRELHSIYILYKALQEVTSQRYDNYNLDEGLDYYTFRNGIYQVFVQSEGLAKMIFNTIDFNFSGFLNWDEFLNLMVIIKAKTLKEKIDLFIKIADADGNGMLSKTEIFNLCKICLSKFISEKESDHFLNNLCDYFTKLIFGAVGIDIEEEIPLETIKEAILSGNEESDLLAMFCGADM